MRPYRLLFLGCLLALRPLLCPAGDLPQPAAFELRDGDRVVLLGNAFIEREQIGGYIETELTRLFPGKEFSFRNLGWSGDTVFGQARSYFGPPQEGFQRLVESVERIDPTLVLVSYGQNEAYQGESGLERFREGLKHLVETLSKTGRRWIFLSPTFREDLGDPLPDPADYNRDLLLYQQTLRQLAEERGAVYVDIASPSQSDDSSATSIPLTDNSLHFTDYGYWKLAQTVSDRLGLDAPPWEVSVDLEKVSIVTHGTNIGTLEKPEEKGLSFTLTDTSLPHPPAPRVLAVSQYPRNEADRIVRVSGLPSGSYTLVIDGSQVLTADSTDWSRGVALASGPEFDQVEQLRALIKEKNTLYFDRWRPQNETYLFGFRKHEQGQNAVEIPQFEPLVADLDVRIQALKVPVPHRYEIRPAGAAR